MSSFSLPSDKFYLRDKTTNEAIELWSPYAGTADYAQFAGAPTGTLATTITQLNNSVTDINSRTTNLEINVGDINTNINDNMNKYLEGYSVIHTQSLGSAWEDTLSAGLYELRLNCDDFDTRLVFLYDTVESLWLNQLVFNPDTNMWYTILFQIIVGSNNSVNVLVKAFDYPGSYTDYTNGNWELYRLASIK